MTAPPARRPLGTTGIDISVVGAGTWAIGGSGWKYNWGPQDDASSVRALRLALGLGVNWIDTAAAYGIGHAEEIVGRVLAGLPDADRPYVFTKCGLRWSDADRFGDLQNNLRPASVRMECEASLRRLGIELGLPREMVYRHPFPGPGLGVRILGEVRKEYADLLRRADAIFIEELRRHDLYDRTSQAFAVFLPVRSVGVMGDGRRYDYVVALRAVETVDFMTAQWARLPYEFLELVSRRIVNEVAGISRVVYDISGKPPDTIEWE